MQFHGEANPIQRRRVGLREAEDDGIGIGRLDGGDVLIERASCRQDAVRRIDYAIVGSLHVGRGHWRTIVKLHISAQPESKGQSIWRGRPGFGDVGLNPHVLPVADVFEQSRVVRADGVQGTKRGASMTVVVGRLGDYSELEYSTTLGRLCRHDARNRRDDKSCGYGDLSNSLDGTQLAEAMHDESSQRRRRSVGGRRQMLLVRPAIVIDRIASHSSAPHRHRVLEAIRRVRASPLVSCSSIPPKKSKNKEGRSVKEDEWEDEPASRPGSRPPYPPRRPVRRLRRRCRILLDL